VRYSGTENLLRVMVEGKEMEEIKTIAENIADSIEKEIGYYE
jgi:phosphoglucosamine mutase